MELKDMTLEDVEARISELNTENKTVEEVEQMTEELKALNERKAELVDLEQRKADAKALEEEKVSDSKVTIIEQRKGEKTMKDVKEYRNSEEYINAYAEYIKSGNDEEVRALLTENVGNAGEVAVPDLVYDIVKTDWLNSGVMAYVRKISVQGNMKVQFELSAGDAVVHDEGSGAVSEEELTLGIVKLIPESIKKWISVSDEVLGMTGESFLRYIYDELTYKIAAKAESILLGKIAALSGSASEDAVSAQTYKAGATISTVTVAMGKLSAENRTNIFVANPATIAAYKAAGKAAQFAQDVFDGLTVVPTNALPSIDSASENDVYAIIGDFGRGALANFPEGEGITIKFDDKTLMEYDLVRILGREFIAVEPVACNAFVKITKPAAV